MLRWTKQQTGFWKITLSHDLCVTRTTLLNKTQCSLPPNGQRPVFQAAEELGCWSDRRTGSEEKDRTADFMFGFIFSRNEQNYWVQDLVNRKPDTSVHVCETLTAFCNAEKCFGQTHQSPKHKNVYVRLTDVHHSVGKDQPEKPGNNLWNYSFSATAIKGLIFNLGEIYQFISEQQKQDGQQPNALQPEDRALPCNPKCVCSTLVTCWCAHGHGT